MWTWFGPLKCIPPWNTNIVTFCCRALIVTGDRWTSVQVYVTFPPNSGSPRQRSIQHFKTRFKAHKNIYKTITNILIKACIGEMVNENQWLHIRQNKDVLLLAEDNEKGADECHWEGDSIILLPQPRSPFLELSYILSCQMLEVPKIGSLRMSAPIRQDHKGVGSPYGMLALRFTASPWGHFRSQNGVEGGIRLLSSYITVLIWIRHLYVPRN